MTLIPKTISNTFNRFVESEKAGGILLIGCTIISLLLANSPVAETDRKSTRLNSSHWE